MPKSTQKVTALILAALIFTANLGAGLAHRHFSPENCGIDFSFSVQQAKLPKLDNTPKLCSACLFFHEHHGLLTAFSVAATLSASIAIASPSFFLPSQLDEIFYNNRAPPSANYGAPLV